MTPIATRILIGQSLPMTSSSPRKGLVFGVYFSTDWCQPCIQFTPVLVAFAKTQSTDFTLILKSEFWLAEETEQYFARMPWPHWAAMEHEEASKACGAALRQKFGVKTIPALVLPDSNGNIICAYGRKKLGADPTGKGFPWTPSARGWPPNNFGDSRVIGPTGEPPTFNLPTNVSKSKPTAGQSLLAKAATRGEEEKERLVKWQMENQVHARA